MIVLCRLKSIPLLEVVSQNSTSECTTGSGGGGLTGPGSGLSLLQDNKRMKARVTGMDLKDEKPMRADI
jgi:hypothetical protein